MNPIRTKNEQESIIFHKSYSFVQIEIFPKLLKAESKIMYKLLSSSLF